MSACQAGGRGILCVSCSLILRIGDGLFIATRIIISTPTHNKIIIQHSHPAARCVSLLGDLPVHKEEISEALKNTQKIKMGLFFHDSETLIILKKTKIADLSKT